MITAASLRERVLAIASAEDMTPLTSREVCLMALAYTAAAGDIIRSVIDGLSGQRDKDVQRNGRDALRPIVEALEEEQGASK
jgi:hypothetical protein